MNNDEMWKDSDELKKEEPVETVSAREVYSEPIPNTQYQRVYSNTYPNDFYSNTYDTNSQNTNRNHNTEKPKKKHGLLGKVATCLLLGTIFGGFAGISFVAVKGFDSYMDKDKVEVSVTKESVAQKGSADSTSNEINVAGDSTAVVTDVTKVVKEVMPSVVSITNKTIIEENYFGRVFTQEQEGSGSGIIIGQNDSELLIVTNYHVVSGSKELNIQFIDGEKVIAQVKGTDPEMDLAVVAVSFNDLKDSTKNSIVIAELGDSDSLQVGEPAIAIGNALGYGQSVTTGVISALDRAVQMQSADGSTNVTEGNLIQTDAAINPGNSGGALLNTNGQVIGINSNKMGGGIVEGMGYAIPISKALPILEELMMKETKALAADNERGYLGIAGITVSNELVQSYGVPEGVLVEKIYENTGAKAAGLQAGDIITKFDGNKVTSMETLTSLLAYYKIGDTVELVVMEGTPFNYTEKKVSITLGEKFE